jgi:hypothetical protein
LATNANIILAAMYDSITHLLVAVMEDVLDLIAVFAMLDTVALIVSLSNASISGQTIQLFAPIEMVLAVLLMFVLALKTTKDKNARSLYAVEFPLPIVESAPMVTVLA